MVKELIDFGGNQRAGDMSLSEIDGTTYFDENESRFGGSLTDEATGKPYNNDQDMDSIAPEGEMNTDHVKDIIADEDPTEKYLRENDPEYYKKHKKEWGK